MKKFILNIISFSAIFAVFYLVSLWAIGTISLNQPMLAPINFKYPVNSNGHMHSRFEDLKSIGEVDVLFMGASTCYRHYDVRVFEESGFKAFNLGSSGQSPLQTLAWYQAVKENLKPKLIVFDVNPYTF